MDRRYAIIKELQHKSVGGVRRSLEHAYREKLMPEALRRIDAGRSTANFYGLKDHKKPTVDEKIALLEERLEPYYDQKDGYRKIQTGSKNPKYDTVLVTEFVITMSPEIAEKMKPQERTKYFNSSLGMLRELYGKDNVLGVAYHRDEKTDHAHIFVIPERVETRSYKQTSREKKKGIQRPDKVCHSLSSSYYIGSKAKLRELWDKVAEVGQEFGMVRGRRGSLLERQDHKRFHEDVKAAQEAIVKLFEPQGAGLLKESPKAILERLRPVFLDLYTENLSLQGYAKAHEKEAAVSNTTMKQGIVDFYKMMAGLNADEKREVVQMVQERVKEKAEQKKQADREYQARYRASHPKTSDRDR